MEAHGAPVGKLAQRITGLLPDAVAAKLMETAGVNRLSAFHLAIELVRRGGTICAVNSTSRGRTCSICSGVTPRNQPPSTMDIHTTRRYLTRHY
jgi:hypothetical protein